MGTKFDFGLPTSVADQQIDTGHDTQQRLISALIRTGEKDHSAFHEVYTLTSAKLFGICMRVCQQRQGAEDVLHEVYVTVWRCAADWDPARGSPIAWLSIIARNRAIDWRRAQVIRPAASAEEAHAIPDPAPHAESLLLRQDRNTTLHRCLKNLEVRQSEVIFQAFYGGATYAELAQERGVPLGTVKSWVRRGLLEIKRQLSEIDQ